MTIIRPVTAQDIRLKEKIADAVKNAGLNLSEVNALNNRFGTTIKYVPQGDTVDITYFIKKNGKNKMDSFAKDCYELGHELAQTFGKPLKEHLVISDKKTFAGNLTSALEKLKGVLK